MRFTTLVFIAMLSMSVTGFGQLTSSRDGKLDRSFGTNGVVMIDPNMMTGQWWGQADIGQLPDGKVVAMYESIMTGTATNVVLVRCLNDGRPDASFGTNGKMLLSDWPQFIPRRMVIQTDGKIILGGMNINGE